MNIVGYGTDATTKLDYWVVRNSWGTSWGQVGYVLVQRGVNMCNIEKYARYLVSTWQSATTSVSASGGVVRFDDNCSFFSGSVSGYGSASKDACWTTCLNDDTCAYFWFYSDGCFMKTAADTSTTGVAGISLQSSGTCGFITGRSNQFLPTGTAAARAWQQARGGLIRYDVSCDFSALGTLINSQTATTNLSCFNLCLNNANCSHFVYNTATQTCSLRSIPAGGSAASGTTVCGYVAGRSNQPLA